MSQSILEGYKATLSNKGGRYHFHVGELSIVGSGDSVDAAYAELLRKVEAIERDGDSVVVTFIERHSGERLTERFDYLLAATGRRPNVDRLGIENANLSLNDKGVPSYNSFTLQCRNADGSPSHIFIAGDADQDLPLLHEASDEGRIAGDNAGRYPEMRAGQRRTPLAVVFSDPQMATVGLSYAELERRYGGCDCLASGEVSFEGQGRSRVRPAKSAISSSFLPRIKTTLTLIGSNPTRSAASIPAMIRPAEPGLRDSASIRSGRRESSEMLTRLTPAPRRASLCSSRSTALVDRDKSSIPGTAAIMRARSGRSRRTNGSPPVIRTRRSPRGAIVAMTSTISS